MSSIGRESTFIDIDIDINLLNDLNTRVDNLETNVGLPSIPNLRDATALNAKVENVEKADTIVPHYDKAYTYYVLLDDKHEVATDNEHKNITVNNLHNSNLNEIVEKLLTDVEVLKIQNKLTGTMITQAGFGKGDTRIQSGPTTRITFNTRDLSSVGFNTDNIPIFDGALTADNVEEKLTAFIEWIEHNDNSGIKQLLDLMGLNTNDLDAFLEEILKAQDPIVFLENILLSRVYIGTEGDLYINANPLGISGNIVGDIAPIWVNLNVEIPAIQLQLAALAIEETLQIGEQTWAQFRDSLFGAGTVGIGALVVALATLLDQVKKKADRMWDEGNLLAGTSGDIYHMSSGNVAIGIPKPIAPPLLPNGNRLPNRLEVNGNINIREGFQYKINDKALRYRDLEDPLQEGTNIEIEEFLDESIPDNPKWLYRINNTYLYELPKATASVLGGVTIGDNITLDDGKISVVAYSLPKATASVLGGVTIGDNITLDDGKISVVAYSLPKATASVLGGVTIGDNITLDDGKISVVAYSLPKATASVLGGVTIGDNITLDDGKISVVAYSLPKATASVLGGVTIGDNITLDDGKISVVAYSLPKATASVLGGVTIGNNITLDDGKISVAAPYSLPKATASVLGGVTIGNNITLDDGKISVAAPYSLPKATASVLGGVTIGNNITLDDGKISVAAPYSLPKATANVWGGVTIGNNITLDDGKISVAAPYSLPKATANVLGGVTIGDNITLDDGKISVDKATSSVFGVVKVNDAKTYNTTVGSALINTIVGSPLHISDGTISMPIATAQYWGANPETDGKIGGVMVDNITISINPYSGVISFKNEHYTKDETYSNLYIYTKSEVQGLGGANMTWNAITNKFDISLPAAYSLPIATGSVLGGVMVDTTTIAVNATGVISAIKPSKWINATDTSTNIYYDTGNVGIGKTSSITNKLEVNGNINIPLSSNYKINNQPLNYSHLAGTPPVSSKWTTESTNNIFYNTGNVGIGKTTALTNKLEVGGNLNISSGSKYKIGDVNLAFSDLGGTLSYNSLTNTLTAGTNISIVNNVVNNTYSLPTASTSVSGGVKVDGTTITINGSGVISGANTYSLPTATTSVLGGVKVDGTTIQINGSGVISGANTYSLPTATTSVLGGVKVDGTTITINGSGVISGANTYSLPTATTSVLGGVKVDGTTIQINNQVISASVPAEASKWTTSGVDIYNNNTGNVGIGTITPTIGYKLDVRGSILTNGSFATTGTGFIFGGGNGSSITRSTAAISFYGLDDITFRGYNKIHLVSGSYSDTISPALTITTENNVGIGTTGNTTGYKLSVAGSIISSGSMATDSVFGFSGVANSEIARVKIANGYSTSSVVNDMVIRSTRDLRLQSGTTDPAILIQNTTNNVLIGSITNSSTDDNTTFALPDSTLFVRGAKTAGSTTNITFRGGLEGNNGGKVKIWLANDASHSSYIQSEHTTLGNTQLTFGTANGNALPTEKMKISNDGRIDIGNSLVMTGLSPTIYLKDTDQRSGMIHMNSSVMYFLRGSGNGSETWQQLAPNWPLQLNMDTNEAVFGGTLNLPPDRTAITSGGGARTYYINNGASLYWGYGTGNTHEFRNSANTNIFTINNGGGLAIKENTWHADLAGYLRFYFEANSTTYLSGHGTGGCVEFRQNTNTPVAKVTHLGQWGCYFRTVANSNTDDIGVNVNTTLDALGFYYAHIIFSTFTGFHRCYYADDEIFNNDSSKEETDIFKNNYKGRIVISTGKIKTDLSRPVPKECKEEPNNNLEEPNIDYIKPINCEQIDKENPNMEWYTAIDKDGITIEEAIPIVQLCRVKKDKRVYGVLGSPDRNSNNKNRLIVNSLGEGAICVCNSNGNIENGDYIQSSELLGYGEKQDDDLLHNYSVAKAVMDCNFELDNPYYQCYELEGGVRVAFIACTYHCG